MWFRFPPLQRTLEINDVEPQCCWDADGPTSSCCEISVIRQNAWWLESLCCWCRGLCPEVMFRLHNWLDHQRVLKVIMTATKTFYLHFMIHILTKVLFCTLSWKRALKINIHNVDDIEKALWAWKSSLG